MDFLKYLQDMLEGKSPGGGGSKTGGYYCKDCNRSIRQTDRKAKILHGRGKMANWNKPCGRKQ